jgi:hypothetical protein
MRNVIATFFLLFVTSTTFAATYSVRDNLSYGLGEHAVHTVFTFPAQPFQPVYAWRTHTRFDGSPGIHSQYASYIGSTDGNGVLTIVVPHIPDDGIHCGWFTDEQVAVGSPNAPRSASLSFTISITGPIFSPPPPWLGACTIPFLLRN